MKKPRLLTSEEINALENYGCWAEDWSSVTVAEGPSPKYLNHALFYGEDRLGAFEGVSEVTKGFFKHSGIINATLRSVAVGDSNLIENVGNYINNYATGGNCFIPNICTPGTTEGVTYDKGNTISVLSEVGDGNVVLFRELDSQFVAFMVQYFQDKALKDTIFRLIKESMALNRSDQAWIGNRVKIVNTKETTNTIIFDDCEINGASRLSDYTILDSKAVSVHIRTGVICENSIILHGSPIINSVKVQGYFVGKTYQITNGFTASSSIFFANSYTTDGEACATLCDSFSSNHHKSSLLAGGMFSSHNAGSVINPSGHAYKMRPVHYDVLQRGRKTASGAYLLIPMNTGTFSVCFDKSAYHPDTRSSPFSYLIVHGDIMYLLPGRNTATVGLYRDINRWLKRDLRPQHSQKSIVNFDWLPPSSVGEIVEGKRTLEGLCEASGNNASTYNYHGYVTNASLLEKGIRYYDIALHTYVDVVLKRVLKKDPALTPPITTTGVGKQTDLVGLLLSVPEKERLIDGTKNGGLETVDDMLQRFMDISEHYREYQWAWVYEFIKSYYQLDIITLADVDCIRTDYIGVHRAWIAGIGKDVEKEFTMGDVEQNLFDNFVGKLDRKGKYEDWQYVQPWKTRPNEIGYY